jgi:hypothetical protein
MNAVLTSARRGHPGLFWFAVGMAALAAVFVGLAVVDQRTLLGSPLWFKPLKFALSFALYAGALAWMLARLPEGALHRTGWAIVATSTAEMAILAGQAARGVRSHFNDDDFTGVLLYRIAGVTIVALYLATVAVALRFLRARFDDPATASAVRLGLVVSLVGMAVGFVMAVVDSHAIGVPDGGPGLLLFGWSTTGGDLRIVVYAALVLPQFGPFLAGVSSPDLPGVMTLLGSPVGAAAGWAHFIAFDLFIGRWMYLDARERGVHPLVMAPVLMFTILLAPLGLLVYLVLRAVLPARRPVAQPA